MLVSIDPHNLPDNSYLDCFAQSFSNPSLVQLEKNRYAFPVTKIKDLLNRIVDCSVLIIKIVCHYLSTFMVREPVNFVKKQLRTYSYHKLDFSGSNASSNLAEPHDEAAASFGVFVINRSLLESH